MATPPASDIDANCRLTRRCPFLLTLAQRMGSCVILAIRRCQPLSPSGSGYSGYYGCCPPAHEVACALSDPNRAGGGQGAARSRAGFAARIDETGRMVRLYACLCVWHGGRFGANTGQGVGQGAATSC